MRSIAAALVAAVAVASPAPAQDRDNASNMHDRNDTSMRHRAPHHRMTYRRTYKTDDEKRRATEELNRQYRGVPRSDMH